MGDAPQPLGREKAQLQEPGQVFWVWKKRVKHLGYDLWRLSGYDPDVGEKRGCTSGNGTPCQQRKVARRSLTSLGLDILRQKNLGACEGHRLHGYQHLTLMPGSWRWW